MNFILLVFTWALNLSSLQLTVLSTESAAGKTGSPAVVEWLTEQDHDFGAIHKGRPVRFAFQFKNTTPEPIVLETVRTSCGCTAAEWPEAPIGPGETGEINIEYDAYMGGAFRKKIRVFFAQQKKPEILWITGEAE